MLAGVAVPGMWQSQWYMASIGTSDPLRGEEGEIVIAKQGYYALSPRKSSLNALRQDGDKRRGPVSVLHCDCVVLQRRTVPHSTVLSFRLEHRLGEFLTFCARHRKVLEHGERGESLLGKQSISRTSALLHPPGRSHPSPQTPHCRGGGVTLPKFGPAIDHQFGLQNSQHRCSHRFSG